MRLPQFAVQQPAIGMITVSDRFLTILNTAGRKLLGVCPTSVAICPTWSFTEENVFVRLSMIPDTSTPFSQSVICSIMLSNYFLLSFGTGKLLPQIQNLI